MGTLVGKFPCIKCSSSDALCLYDDGDRYGATCRSCNTGFSNDDLAASELGEELGILPLQKGSGHKKQRGQMERRVKERKPVIDDEVIQRVQQFGKHDSTRYRGISHGANEKYGVYTHYENGEVAKRYYPITEDGLLVGYKGREHPKGFFSRGRNDKQCEMFGQSLFPKGGKRLLIVGGEEDAMAAFEMLWRDQYARSGDTYPPVAVVAPTLGETSAYTQVQHHFEWVDKFDEIIVMMDNDEAGRQATASLVEVLPMGKVKVAELPMKDPNKMLEEGKQKDFIQAFWNAKRHNPAGVVGSHELIQKIRERAALEKVPLPPFAKKLQKNMAGGIPLGYIVNIAAASGQGKSTLVNEFIYYWVFNSPYKVGIVSLESDPGEYGELLLSRHVGKKIALLETVKEKLDFLDSDAVQSAMDELFIGEDGEERFHLLDHQGSVGEDELKKKCEYLVRGLGCKLIIVDPLTLALTGSGNDETDEFMAWQKNFVSQHNCIFINVTHIRKNANNQQANSQGATISEESIKGSGSIFQVAGANILLMRDKESDDVITRNTTRAVMSKCRWTGNTGPAGDWYYDNASHKLHDFNDFFEEQASSIDPDAFEEDRVLMQPIIDSDNKEYETKL